MRRAGGDNEVLQRSDSGLEPICPIFVFSCVRSGSSLLRYILDTHPAIYAPPEMNLGGLANAAYQFYSALRSLKAPDPADMSDPEVLAQVRHNISEVLDAETRRRGKLIWCEKTPRNLEALDLLAKLYPDARFVCLYRNRLDTVFSLLETSRYRPMVPLRKYMARQPETLIGAATEYWTDGISSLLAFERQHRKNSYRVRYEDVVAQPEATLPALFSFLGLEWDPRLIDMVYATPHDLGAGDKSVRFAGKIRADRIGAGLRVPGYLTETSNLIDARLRQRAEELDQELGYSALFAASTREPGAAGGPATLAAGGGANYSGPRWVFESHLPSRIRERTNLLPPLGHSYRFVISGDDGGAWLLRRAADGFQVLVDDSAAGADAVTTIGMKGTDLLGLVDGELNVARVVQEGRIAIAGQPPTFEEIEALVALIRTDV